MKKLNSIPFFLLLYGFFMSSSLIAQFRLKVNGVSTIKGNLMIAIYDTKATFLNEERALKRIVIPIKSQDITIELNGLSVNKTYALALYHDSNNNGKLDTNFLGIPTEIYGFSNNVRGTFGPPSFEEASFKLKSENIIEVTLK